MNNYDEQTIREHLAEIDAVCQRDQVELEYIQVIPVQDNSSRKVLMVQTKCPQCGHIVLFDYATIINK